MTSQYRASALFYTLSTRSRDNLMANVASHAVEDADEPSCILSHRRRHVDSARQCGLSAKELEMALNVIGLIPGKTLKMYGLNTLHKSISQMHKCEIGHINKINVIALMQHFVRISTKKTILQCNC